MENTAIPLQICQDLRSRLSKLENPPKSKQKPFYDISLPTPENLTELSFDLLQLLNSLRSDINTNTESNPDKRGSNLTLAHCDPLFVLFILGTSEKGFHSSLAKFYKRFDRNNRLNLEEEEFLSMINIVLKETTLSNPKLIKCFEKITPQSSKRGTQNQPNILNSTLTREIIQALHHKDKVGKSRNKIIVDYFKILPFLITFFSEHINQEIKDRRQVLEKVQGFTKEGIKKQILTANLLEKFEAVGFDSNEKKLHPMSYREIEKTLLLFRPTDIEAFEKDQLHVVLDEVQKKYGFNNEIGDFDKKKCMSKKFLSYLSYRICMHSCCNKISKTKSDDSQAIVEEFVLWNITYNERKLNEDFLQQNFLKYANKKANLNEFISPAKLYDVLSGYMKKVVPTVPKKSLKNIAESFKKIIDDDRNCTPKVFSVLLFDLIIHEAELKLNNYIKQVFQSLAPGGKQKEFEFPTKLDLPKEVFISQQSTPAHNLKIQDSNIHQPSELSAQNHQITELNGSKNLDKGPNAHESKYEEEISNKHLYQSILSDAILNHPELLNLDLDQRAKRLSSLKKKLQQTMSMSKTDLNFSLVIKNPSKILQNQDKAEKSENNFSIAQSYQEQSVIQNSQKDWSVRLTEKSMEQASRNFSLEDEFPTRVNSRSAIAKSEKSVEQASRNFSLEDEFPRRVNSRNAVVDTPRQKEDNLELKEQKASQNPRRTLEYYQEFPVISEDRIKETKKEDRFHPKTP